MAERSTPAHPARLRCRALEPRHAPAGVPVVDFGDGFDPDRLPGGLPAGYADRALLLTDGPFQARAVWAPTPVTLSSFETSFVFRQEGEPGRMGDGFTFALVAAPPARPGAAGGGLGYAGLTDSVAVKFDLVDNAGEGGHSVGVFTGGAGPTVPAARLDGTPVHLHAQHPMRADLRYDGAVLAVTLTDTTLPGHVWAHDFPVDIPAAVGAATGIAGFTAGTGELFARQTIDSWTLAAEPPPTVTAIALDATVSVISPTAVALWPAGAGYTWEAAAPPGATPDIRPMPGDPTRALADLDVPGRYDFRVTARTADGRIGVAEVAYTFPTVLARIDVASWTDSVAAGDTISLLSLAIDSAGQPVYGLAPTWDVARGPGTVDQFGQYTAPADASGPVTVRATALTPSRSGPDALTPLSGEVTLQIRRADDGPPEPGSLQGG